MLYYVIGKYLKLIMSIIQSHLGVFSAQVCVSSVEFSFRVYRAAKDDVYVGTNTALPPTG